MGSLMQFSDPQWTIDAAASMGRRITKVEVYLQEP